MAKRVPWVGLWYDGVWNDVSADVRTDPGTTISWGKKDETSAPVPTSIQLRFDNRQNKYSPKNPMSPLYGKIGRNTPIQVAAATPVAEDFEDTGYSVPWTTGGSVVWARSSTLAHAGTWSLKAGAVASGQISSLFFQNLNVSNYNTFSFWYKTEMSTTSFFSAYITPTGGVGKLVWFVTGSGAADGWRQVILDTSGVSTVTLEFFRIGTASNNTVYIDDVRVLNARATGEVSSWVPDTTDNWDPATPTIGDSWTDIEAGGFLQRLNQSSRPLRSAVYRSIMDGSFVPAEYWPMEDMDGSSRALSAVNGIPMDPVTIVRYTTGDGKPIPPGGAPQFASGAGIPGSDKLPTFQQGGTLTAGIRSGTFTGYAIDFMMQFEPGAADGATSVDIFSWREIGTYVHYTVNVTLTSVTVFHSNAADDKIATNTGSVAAAIKVYDGAPHVFRYQVRQSGGNYVAELYIDDLLYGTADNFATPGVMAGTVGRPRSVEWNPLEDRGAYMPIAAGQVIVWRSGALGAQPGMSNSMIGMRGENVEQRLNRLAIEESWPLQMRDRVADTVDLGPQPRATPGALLKEIEKTEDGLLTDQRGAIGLMFRTRESQYNQTASTLAYGTGVRTLRPVTDDQGTANDVIAKNFDGEEYRTQQLTGPMSVLEPTEGGVGSYPAQVDVNIDTPTESLADISWWWNSKGTIDAARYPAVVLDLDANPTLEPLAFRLTAGDWLSITGLEYDQVPLRVLGGREVWGSHRLLVTFNCVPSLIQDTGVYDDTTERYDSKTTTLAEDITTSETIWDITTADLDGIWSAVDEPYDWNVNGERVRVVTMTAATGTGPWLQQATVTRSINGVVKQHFIGDEIHMHQDQISRYAL